MQPSSVLITGSNRGIGLAFVRLLADLPKPPKHIFATCRNPDDAKDLQTLSAANQSIHLIKLDSTDPDSINLAVAQVQKKVEDEGLNLLINNAGVQLCKFKELETITIDDMKDTYMVNSIGPFLVAQAFTPLLKNAAASSKQPGMSISKAAIINISSFLGSIAENNSGRRYAYRSSKAALNMITKSLSVDLKPHGILAVSLSPGHVRTDLGGEQGVYSTDESVRRMITVMSSMDESSNGCHINHDGSNVPW